MTRLIVIATVVFGLPTLAVAALLVLLAHPETFQDEIAQGFEAATGWQLDIGTMQWRYFPPVSLKLSRVSVENEGPLAELSEASVDVAFWPLVLGGNLELQGIVVDGLKLNLESRAEGANNWTPLDRARPSARLPPPGLDSTSEPTPFDLGNLRIASVDITNMIVVHTDAVAATRTEASVDQLRAVEIGYGAPFEINFSGKLNHGDSLSLVTSGRAHLQLEPGLRRLELNELSLENELSLADLPKVRSTLNLSGTYFADQLKLNQIALTVPGGRLEGSLVFADLSTAPALAGKWSALLNPRKVLEAVGAASALPTGDALQSFRLASDFSASGKELQLTGIEGTLDDAAFNGTATFTAGVVPEVRFELDVGVLDLSALSATDSTPADVAASTTPIADRELIPVALLRSLNADGRVRIAGLRSADLEAANLDLAVILREARLTATFAAEAYGGTVDWQAKVNASSAGLNVSSRLDAHAGGIDVAALAATQWITGSLTLDSGLTSQGSMLSEILASIDGSSHFDITDGTLDVTPLKLATDAADALRGQPSGVADWPDQLNFSSLSGAHVFADGTTKDQVLHFALETLYGRASGGFDLLSDTVDYDVYIVLENKPDSQFKVDASMTGIRWPLACRGSLLNPIELCRPHGAGLRRMVSDIAKKEITGKTRDSLLEALPEDIKGKARDVLEGLFR